MLFKERGNHHSIEQESRANWKSINFLRRVRKLRWHGAVYWVVFLLKHASWSPNHFHGDSIGRWGLQEVIRFRGSHEGGDPMMGLASLQDEEDRPELSLTLPGEDTARRLMSANHEGSSRGTKSASTLILDFLTSRNARNKCLSFEPPSLWHFVIAAWAD